MNHVLERQENLHRVTQRVRRYQILLSQDVGHKHYLQEYGGWGYSHVLTEFDTCMLEAGIDRATINGFLVKKPSRALAIDRIA